MTRSALGLLALLAAPAALMAQSTAQSTAGGKPDLLAPRSKGSAGAPVTVYEMSDFQCPYCRRHAVETFPLLEEAYVRTGKVRWVFINYPLTELHPNAAAAAEFAMCAARAGKFWPVHDLLFKYQAVWAPLKQPAAFLLTLADSVGLPRPAITPCLETHQGRKDVEEDAAGAARAGAASTPTFYIEGGMMSGAAPIAVFRQVLDSIYSARTKAKGSG